MTVELTAGWAKGKRGEVVNSFQENHFGTMWNMIQVAVRNGGKVHIITVTLESTQEVKE